MAIPPRDTTSPSGTDETSVTSPSAVLDHDELPLLMVRAVKAMVADVAARQDSPDSSGLTVMHGIAARYIERNTDATVAELAGHLRVTKQSASEIVAALEREGFVIRRPHPIDGRARALELTDAGRSGLVRSRELWGAMVADWETLVGADDLAAVTRALETYLDAHE